MKKCPELELEEATDEVFSTSSALEEEAQEKAIGQQKGARPKRAKGEDGTKEEKRPCFQYPQYPLLSQEMTDYCQGKTLAIHLHEIAKEEEQARKKLEKKRNLQRN